jgi:predicted methyltransferase
MSKMNERAVVADNTPFSVMLVAWQEQVQEREVAHLDQEYLTYEEYVKRIELLENEGLNRIIHK